MSIKKCCVPNCNTTRTEKTTLHLFPNPNKDNERFNLWKMAIGGSVLSLDSQKIFAHRRVCHLHFESFYHTRSKRLSPNAIPTILLSEIHASTRPPLQDMTIRWGIVTAGKISNDFVNAINSYPDKGDQVIAAVAARDRSKAEEFAKTHNIPKVFSSYAEMATSNDIDVAYIGALNPDHYNLSKLFLESGKHVLCEKPLCLNYKQTKSLLNFAKSKNLFMMEALWSRFAPVYIALEKEIKSGKIGAPQYVEVNFGVPISKVDRLSKKELGGSAVMDIGVYTVQFAQFIFKDDPIKISAIGELNDDGVDLVGTVVLEYSGGRRAVLNYHSRAKLWNKATVVGSDGKRITVEDPFHFPDTLIHVDGRVEKFELHTSKLPYVFGNSAGLVYEAVEVVRCIKEGLIESPRWSHENSLQLAMVLQAVRRQLGVRYEVDDKEFET